MSSELIESVESIIVDIPIKRVHKFSATSITTQAILLIRIRTRNGVVGIGESTTPGGPWWLGESVESMKLMIDSYFSPALIGSDALQIPEVLRKLNKIAALNSFAKAGIEMALFDIKGKVFNAPLHQLLGGLARESVKTCWPLAIGDIDRDVAEAEHLLSENLAQEFKIKMGYREPKEDVAFACSLASALLSRGATVRVDINQAWDEGTAHRWLPVMIDAGVSVIEQPVQGWNHDAMARITGKYSAQVLADESVCTLQDALKIGSLRFADAFALKAMKSGGILAAQKIAGIAEAAGVPCFAGCFLEASIGSSAMVSLACALPNATYGSEQIGPIWLKEEIVEDPVEIRDNRIWVKHGPGLGVTISEEKLQRYRRR